MSGVWRAAASLAPLTVAWLWTWSHLAAEWRAHPHYEYGWGVPVLGLILLLRRWPGAMRPPAHRAAASALLLAGVLLWGLGELVRRHDPIWRLAGGFLLAGSTALTAAWLWQAGGGPLLRRQAWPLAFLWTALPWPMPVEQVATQSLLHFVTTIAVLGSTAAGLPMLQSGNVIHLASGAVGVEEACSGIQSLQAALMAGLFLGEFYRLPTARRVLLLIAGSGLAILGNLARVLALVNATARGMASQTHDLIGALSTAGIFLGLLAATWWLHVDRPGDMDQRERFAWPTPVFGFGLALGLAAFLLGSAGLPLSRPLEAPRLWPLAVDTLPARWRAEPVYPSRKETAMLRFSSAEGWNLQTAEGSAARLYRFTWRPGQGMPPLAFTHTPGLCLPSAGWIPQGPPVGETLTVHGKTIPATRYAFIQGNNQLVAYQMVSAGGVPRSFAYLETAAGHRWQRFISQWNAPREVIDEELLLYLPLRSANESAPVLAQVFLEAALHAEPTAAPALRLRPGAP